MSLLIVPPRVRNMRYTPRLRPTTQQMIRCARSCDNSEITQRSGLRSGTGDWLRPYHGVRHPPPLPYRHSTPPASATVVATVVAVGASAGATSAGATSAGATSAGAASAGATSAAAALAAAALAVAASAAALAAALLAAALSAAAFSAAAASAAAASATAFPQRLTLPLGSAWLGLCRFGSQLRRGFCWATLARGDSVFFTLARRRLSLSSV